MNTRRRKTDSVPTPLASEPAKKTELKGEEEIKNDAPKGGDLPRKRRRLISNRDKPSSSEDDDSDFSESLGDVDTDEEQQDTAALEEFLRDMDEQALFEYKRVRDHLQMSQPSPIEILKMPIALEEKATLVELFELYAFTPAYSYEWYDAKVDLQRRIKRTRSKIATQAALSIAQRDAYQVEMRALEAHVQEDDLAHQIVSLPIPTKDKQLVFNKYYAWKDMDTQADEYSKCWQWLHTVVSFPWGKTLPMTPVEECLTRLHTSLEKHLWGLPEIKQRILIYVHHRLAYPQATHPVLALHGPPGCGKTSIVQCIAESLQRPFYACTGAYISSQDSLYGHAYTYIGSEPSVFTRAMLTMGTTDGIVFVDEFEKIPIRDSIAGILQLFDTDHNRAFMDRYMNIAIDCSRLWFVLAMNEFSFTSSALVDRLYPVEFKKYTAEDKEAILRERALPRVVAEIEKPLKFTPDALKYIVSHTETLRQCIQCIQTVARTCCALAMSVIKREGVMCEWTFEKAIDVAHLKAMKAVAENETSASHLSMYR